MLLQDKEMTVVGPPQKKTKTIVNDIILEAILSKDITGPVPLVPVLTAIVKNKKFTSLLVKKFNEHFPIDKLQHLKRVNSKKVEGALSISVILWEVIDICDNVSRHKHDISDKLDVVRGINFNEAIEEELEVAYVASYQPFLTAQYDQLRSSDSYW